MARPKREAYDGLCIDGRLKSTTPTSFQEYQTGELCPKAQGIMRWVCDNNNCAAATGNGTFLYTPMRCGRRKCIICAHGGDKMRGSKLFERLGKHGIGIWVFTLPRPYDALIPPKFLKELEKRFRKRMEYLYLKWTGARIGYRQWWHPTGDVCTNCGYQEQDRTRAHLSSLSCCPNCGVETQAHPHLNFVIPLNGWNLDRKNVYDNPVMKKLKAKLKKSQIVEMKQQWAIAINEMVDALGISMPPMLVKSVDNEQLDFKKLVEEGTNSVANCHYQFVPAPRKISTINQMKHRMSYFARAFPAWEDALKNDLHRGRDFGLLTNVSKGNTALARKKYRESIVMQNVDIELSERDITDMEQKPLCPLCMTGKLTQLDMALPPGLARKGVKISGPYYNKDKIPIMEISWQKTQSLFKPISCKNLQPVGQNYKTASNIAMH